MKLSIFADSKFITDGNGNYYSSSNMRKAMLLPIAEKCEKLYIACRVSHADMGHIPAEDMINHPNIEFIEISPFRGIIGSTLQRRKIRPQIERAINSSDVCVLRFASNISSQAITIAKAAQKPTIGHILDRFDNEVRTNPKHIPIPLLRNLVANWILRQNCDAFQQCDIYCGVTENIATQYAPPRRKVIQLVDSCLSDECYSAPVARSPKNLRAIFAGRLVEFKNVQTFLLAVKILKDQGTNILSTIVGQGNYLPNLQRLAGELGISDSVTFTGRVESRKKLWELYRTADVGFLVSLSEGLPLGAIEPMSVGLPLVAANMEYMTPVITNGQEGFLVNPGDPNDIADKLAILAKDAQLRFEMGSRAFERSKIFSARSQADKLVDLAEELFDKKH